VLAAVLPALADAGSDAELVAVLILTAGDLTTDVVAAHHQLSPSDTSNRSGSSA
jgi:hypothetical protein